MCISGCPWAVGATDSTDPATQRARGSEAASGEAEGEEPQPCGVAGVRTSPPVVRMTFAALRHHEMLACPDWRCQMGPVGHQAALYTSQRAYCAHKQKHTHTHRHTECGLADPLHRLGWCAAVRCTHRDQHTPTHTHTHTYTHRNTFFQSVQRERT